MLLCSIQGNKLVLLKKQTASTITAIVLYRGTRCKSAMELRIVFRKTNGSTHFPMPSGSFSFVSIPPLYTYVSLPPKPEIFYISPTLTIGQQNMIKITGLNFKRKIKLSF